MKRTLLALAAIFALCTSIFAQAVASNIPVDENVKVGKLSNGLTYYVRHNEWPEKRAFFYIAQKVGSVQEEENQRGLAHFLEHMCFNGTTHFPGDKLKKYLETIGVKFGENLNAYTSFDETVYNIDNVNVETPGAIDSCLLILHDWSHDLLLEDKEIDKERGVINEEWRMRSSAMMRMYEKALPELYPDSKYGTRLPIGTMDIVMNFPYDALRSYYKKWYRPDLQSIVIVGDVDVEEMVKKIETLFADIKSAPADAAPLEYFQVPDNAEPIGTINKDKEQDRTLFYLMWKTEAYPRAEKNNIQYLVVQYALSAISSMFGDRIDEIVQKENAPFVGASFGYDDYMVSKTKGAFNGVVMPQGEEYKQAIQGLYREILRIKKYGFTVSEFERFKTEFLSQVEKQYNRRDKISSQNYVNEYVRHFIDNEPIPGIEWEYATYNQMIVPAVTVDMVNSLAMENITQDGKNLAIAAFCPDKEGAVYPTKEEILEWMKEVEAEDIEAYVEEVNTDPLIENLPAEGSVKKIANDIYDSKLITLNNGIKIRVKKTDFSPNQITLYATSWGGTSLYSNDEYDQASSVDMVDIGGIGNFSATELTKKLAGIQASAGASIGDRTESVSGSCVKKDFETMLQLVYLTFTAPRKDVEAFNSAIQRSKAQLANQDMDPMTAFQDTIASVVYNNNVRRVRTKAEDLDKLNYDRILEIYKERFADANDFDFFIIGDCDADTIAPLLAKYLGALPVLKSTEKNKIIDCRIAKGQIKNVFEKELQTPTANVIFLYNAPVKETLKNIITLDMLKQIMQMTYTETVREDEGGAYSVGVSSSLQTYPEKIALFQVFLPTGPEKREHMTEIIYKGIDDMMAKGPKDEDIQKVKEYLLRAHTENLKKNGYWLNQMVDKVRNNNDFVTGYEDAVKSVTAKDIKAMANIIFKSGNRIEIGMTSPAK